MAKMNDYAQRRRETYLATKKMKVLCWSGGLYYMHVDIDRCTNVLYFKRIIAELHVPRECKKFIKRL